MMPDSKRDSEAIARRIASLSPDKRALLALLLEQQRGAGLSHVSGQEVDAERRSRLVAIQPAGSKLPLFCVPPLFGTIFPYYNLVSGLGKARPLYGVQPLGIDGTEKPQARIEDMATYAIEAIRTVQPTGPYLLAGYSFGGLVTFEMAKQLHKAGQQLRLLALFDTWAPVSVSKLDVHDALAWFLTSIIRIWPYVYDYGALMLASWREPTGTTAHHAPIRPMLRVFTANARAIRRYVPGPSPHRITLFRTGKPSARRHYDPTRGWAKLARGVEVHWVTGDHLAMMRKPHVHDLADKLKACLDREG